jgi:hypothetical protein
MQYHQNRRQKLQIISVFREPVERHISSFFQWYGSRPLIGKPNMHFTKTLIYKKSIEALQQRFLNEINSQKLHGRHESLFSIRQELNISKLNFSEKEKYGRMEGAHYVLHLFRFDQLINDFAALLQKATGQPVVETGKNMGNQKWYAEKHQAFKQSLVLSEETIRLIYEPRKSLINTFYDNGYDQMLKSTLQNYSVKK